MAQSPRFKIINPQGEYVASCKRSEDAAMIAAVYGDGAKVRDGSTSGPVVWHEGSEKWNAADSYDRTSALIWERIKARNAKAYARIYGEGEA